MKTLNNSITETYCSFEVSKLLKEKGFKVPVTKYYLDRELKVNFEESNGEREYYFDADDFYENRNDNGVMTKKGGWCFGCKLDNVKYFEPFSAPTHALAIEWIRVNKNIFIALIPVWNNVAYSYQYQVKDLSNGNQIEYSAFNSPQEANEAALLYVLKNLV